MNAWKTQYLEGWLGQEDPEPKLPQQQNETHTHTHTKSIKQTNKTPLQTMFQNCVEQNERKLTLDM